MGAMDATDIPRDGEVSKDPSALYYGVAPMPPSLLVAVFCAGGGGRAVCLAMLHEGAPEIRLVMRTP